MISAGAVEAANVEELLDRSRSILREAIGATGVDVRLVDPTLLPPEPLPATEDQVTDAATVVALDLPPQRALDPLEQEFVSSARNLIANAVLRRAAEDKTRHQALHDMLTGLPNRLLFLDRLAHALARVGREQGSCAVLFIDLDGFKAVNDTYGHAAGDQILMATADRLTGVLRRGDTAARFSGDEFVILCERATGDEGLRVAERVIDLLGQPVPLPPRGTGSATGSTTGTATVGASIGVAEARPGDDPELVLRLADTAMYQAEAAGKGTVVRAPVPGRPAPVG